jgi:hypothetical protein
MKNCTVLMNRVFVVDDIVSYLVIFLLALLLLCSHPMPAIAQPI